MNNLSAQKWLIALVLIYFGLYLGCVTAQIESTEFMEVDPASIIGSLNGLFRAPIYNMNEHYHSQVYGWTYFALNFAVLAPFKWLGASSVVTNTVVQAVLFLVGLGLTVAFYFASLRALGSKVVAAIVTLLFLLNPIAGHFFITVHPETTGALSYLLGILFLHQSVTKETGKLASYMVAVVFLALSSMSKQPFFIVSFFILIGYLGYVASRDAHGLTGFVRSWRFAALLLLTTVVSLLVAFIVHPYAFIEFSRFIEFQQRPLSHSEGDLEAWDLWMIQLARNPVIWVNFSLMLLFPLRKQLRLPRLFVYSVLASSFVAVLFMFMQRKFINANYLYPVLPVILLNIAYAAKKIYQLVKERLPRNAYYSLVAIVLVICLPLLFLSATQTVYYAYKKPLLDGRTTNERSWSYINNLPADSSIYYMPGIGMPPDYLKKSCHVWRECNTLAGIQSSAPDYLFIIWSYKYFDPEPIKQYMDEAGYNMIDVLKPSMIISPTCGQLPPELGVFANLNLMTTFSRILNCRSQLAAIYRVYSEKMTVGAEITIYKKGEAPGRKHKNSP